VCGIPMTRSSRSARALAGYPRVNSGSRGEDAAARASRHRDGAARRFVGKALLRVQRAPLVQRGVARARCVVAEAEIALVSRDLGWPAKALDAARATLERTRPIERAHRASRDSAPAPDRASTKPTVLRELDPAPFLPRRDCPQLWSPNARDASGQPEAARRWLEPKLQPVPRTFLR